MIRTNTQIGPGDKMCLPPWARVFTLEYGWMTLYNASFHKELHILSVSPIKNDAIRFLKVKQWHRYPVYHTDEMYVIDDDQYRLLCTFDHKLYVSDDSDFTNPYLKSIGEIYSSNLTEFYLSSFIKSTSLINVVSSTEWKYIDINDHTFAILLLLCACVDKLYPDRPVYFGRLFPLEDYANDSWVLPKKFISSEMSLIWMIYFPSWIRDTIQRHSLSIRKGSSTKMDTIMTWVKKQYTQHDTSVYDIVDYFSKISLRSR